MNNNKYHFVRVEKIKPTDDSKGCWYFIPNGVDQVKEHWNKYCASIIREGSRHLARKVFTKVEGHSTNAFELAVEARQSIGMGESLAMSMFSVEMEAFNNRMRDIENGKDIYLTQGLSVFLMSNQFYRITAEIDRDKLTFPDEEKPTLDDVRYIMWPGGEHYYAKVGNLDIVDVNNRQKWNTKKEAEKAAAWFIERNF